jgi:protein ImuB
MFEFVRSDAVDLERRVVSGVDAAVGWRGAVPSPAPSLVFDTSELSNGAPEIAVLDAHQRPLVVNARHAMSAEPARVLINDVVYDVVAWAGPWPVEECWWDQRRARRTVRLQLLVRDVGSLSVTRAMIAVLERSVWRLAAWYA